MTILTASSVDSFFNEVVEDAMKTRGIDATAGTTRYLISMLTDFAKPGEMAEQTLQKPLAFLLDEALHTAELGERFDRLRSLGDGVLYSSGFFGDHFEARGIDQSYLIGIGTTAYSRASSLLQRGEDKERSMDIFGELADKFASFVQVIAAIADWTVARGSGTPKGLLRLYERWLKTRSDSLADALSAHGFISPKGNHGSGGVLQ